MIRQRSVGEVRLMTVHGAKWLRGADCDLARSARSMRTGGGRTDDQLLRLSGIGPLWVPARALMCRPAMQRAKRRSGWQKKNGSVCSMLPSRVLKNASSSLQIRRGEDKGGLYTWFNKAKEVAQEKGQRKT